MPYRPAEPEDYRDEEWLREKYHDERLSSSEIADLCDCAKSTILRWMDRHGIEKRLQSEATKVEWEGDEERREETAERMAEQNRVNRCSYFMDDEGYMIASDGKRQVRLHRLIAVADSGFGGIAEADVVHHRLNIPWLNFGLNLEPLSHTEHRERHL